MTVKNDQNTGTGQSLPSSTAPDDLTSDWLKIGDDLRKILKFHRQIGLVNYPVTPALQQFLHRILSGPFNRETGRNLLLGAEIITREPEQPTQVMLEAKAVIDRAIVAALSVSRTTGS